MRPEINILSLQALAPEKALTESVPVPVEISEQVENRPEALGLPAGISKRQGLSAILKKGYETILFENRERNREETYARLANDAESQAAVRVAFLEAREDGLF